MVTANVHMVDTMKKIVLDEAGVVEKFGVRPEQIIDYLALMGDSSDNVPGVPKVGPKTAVKWISEYGSLDDIIANAEKIGGKVGENLREFIPQIPRSKDLVTIRCELPLSKNVGELKQSEPDDTTLVDLYKTLQFKKWLAELGEDLEPESAEVAVPEFKAGNYETIFTKEAFREWLVRLKSCEGFCFDTETTSIDAQQAELVGISFAIESGEAAYVPLAHSYCLLYTSPSPRDS